MHIIFHSFIIIYLVLMYISKQYSIWVNLLIIINSMFTSTKKQKKLKTCQETINAAADVSSSQVARETICTEPVALFLA